MQHRELGPAVVIMVVQLRPGAVTAAIIADSCHVSYVVMVVDATQLIMTHPSPASWPLQPFLLLIEVPRVMVVVVQLTKIPAEEAWNDFGEDIQVTAVQRCV